MPLLSDTTNSSIKDDDDDDSFDNNQCKGDCATVTSGDVWKTLLLTFFCVSGMFYLNARAGGELCGKPKGTWETETHWLNLCSIFYFNLSAFLCHLNVLLIALFFFVGMCLFPSICVEEEATRKELIAAWPRGMLRKRGSLKTKHQAANTLSISTRPPASFIIASRAHFSQCWGEEWNRRKTKNNKRMEMKPIRSNGRKTCYVQLIHEIQ